MDKANIQLRAAPKGVSWGTTNTPVEKRIDFAKEYTTRDGKPVFGLDLVLHNSCGGEVTFPVKGSINIGKTPSGRKKKSRFQIWTLDGRADLFNETPDDLVKV